MPAAEPVRHHRAAPEPALSRRAHAARAPARRLHRQRQRRAHRCRCAARPCSTRGAPCAWLARPGLRRRSASSARASARASSMLTAAHEPLVTRRRAESHLAVFRGRVWEGLSTVHVREGLDGKIDLETLRRIWMPISPFPYLERVRGKRMLLVYARYDLTFPVDALEVAGERVPEARHRARGRRAAVRPLQHRRDAVQVDRRDRVVPVPEPKPLTAGLTGDQEGQEIRRSRGQEITRSGDSSRTELQDAQRYLKSPWSAS